MLLPGSEDVIRIVQRNRERKILILEAGEAAAELVKTEAAALQGREISAIFPKRIMEDVEEDVAFNAEGEDISEVLRKIRRMTVLTAAGEEKPIILKILPDGVEGMDIVYSMSIRSEAAEQSRQDKRVLARAMAERGVQFLDKTTGVPDRIAFMSDLEKVHAIIGSEKADATVALVIIAPEVSEHLLKIAEACRASLRTEDTLARYAENAFGIILMDAHKNNAPIAFHRMRMALGALPVSLVIAYDSIEAAELPEQLLKRCDEIAANAKPSSASVTILDMKNP